MGYQIDKMIAACESTSTTKGRNNSGLLTEDYVRSNETRIKHEIFKLMNPKNGFIEVWNEDVGKVNFKEFSAHTRIGKTIRIEISKYFYKSDTTDTSAVINIGEPYAYFFVEEDGEIFGGHCWECYMNKDGKLNSASFGG